jgi:hypothetical protein
MESKKKYTTLKKKDSKIKYKIPNNNKRLTQTQSFKKIPINLSSISQQKPLMTDLDNISSRQTSDSFFNNKKINTSMNFVYKKNTNRPKISVKVMKNTKNKIYLQKESSRKTLLHSSSTGYLIMKKLTKINSNNVENNVYDANSSFSNIRSTNNWIHSPKKNHHKLFTENIKDIKPNCNMTFINKIKEINLSSIQNINPYSNNNNYNFNYKNNNNSNIKINNQGYTKYQNQNSNQPSRIQNSQSYSGNRNQPRRPEVSSNYYKPKAMSPNPGSIKRKTINRGKPIENIQITHIIYSSRPLEFHITEELDLNNLEKDPIQITESQRNNLKKSGKVEATSSCDNIDIVKPEVNLDGKLTHYQHCQGIGMTDDISDKINPKYYSSEIKNLEPLVFNSGEPIIEILEFRSAGKNYTTTKTTTIIKKTEVKPKTNYNNTRGTSSITQTKVYNNNKNLKTNNINSNNRGVGNSIKTTTTSSNYRANTGNDGSGKIVKETTTKVQMGRRSQFLNNQVKPVSTTSTEKVIMNQNSFFKK